MYVIFRLNFLFGYRFRLFCAHLEAVKSLTIYTYDSTLRHKGVRVYLIDDTEDKLTLAALGKHEEYLYVTPGIESLGIDDGTSAMRLAIDALTYLMIPLRDNEELHRAAHRVDHPVDTECSDVEHHIAVDHLLPTLKYKV